MTVLVNTPLGAIPLLSGGAEAYVRFFEDRGDGPYVPIAAGIDVVGEFCAVLDDWRAEGSNPDELPARVGAWAEVCSGVVAACDPACGLVYALPVEGPQVGPVERLPYAP